MEIPVITVVGKSKSGKTTLMVKLIAELKRRQYHVGTVKHHSHSGFDIDRPGKDSWRHAEAGSEHVIIAAPDKVASYRLLKRELSLQELVATMSELDIVLVEGYCSAGFPSLEVAREFTGYKLITDTEQRFAVASDSPLDVGVPCFDLNDAQSIADMIETRFLASGDQ
jgi:molybdopterin-guanine dinucleotide biosynthesis protein B